MRKITLFCLSTLSRFGFTLLFVGILCGTIVYAYSQLHPLNIFAGDETLLKTIQHLMAYYGVFFFTSLNVVSFLALNVFIYIKRPEKNTAYFLALHAFHVFLFSNVFGANLDQGVSTKDDFVIFGLVVAASLFSVYMATKISNRFDRWLRKLFPS